MTPHGLVTRATLQDAIECAGMLRAEDARELSEVGGMAPVDALKVGVLLGEPSYALRTHSGDLVAILSVVPFGTSTGIVAMSGTSLLEQNSVSFLRGSLDVLAHLDATYETLFNICDARNEVHLKWLQWLGFTFLRKIDRYGPEQVPVIEFARIRPCVTR